MLVATSPTAGQQWRATNGPLSGEVTAVAVTPEGVVVAGTAGKGLFYKGLSDEDWTRSPTTSFDGITIRAIVIYKETVVVATAGKGVWRSADGGENWSGLSTGLGSLIVHALLVSSNDRIYAGTSDGLYGMTQADSWTRVTGGIEGHDIRTIAENSSATLFAGSYGRGVLRSTDSGLTWELFYDGLLTTIIRSLVVDNQDHVFVGTFGGSVVQRSDDNGETWVPSGDGLDDQGIWSIGLAPNGTFYAGSRGRGIFASDDGKTWRHLPTPITAVSGFAFQGDRVLAATGVGLLSSGNSQDEWSLTGIPRSRVNTLYRSGDRILAGLNLGGVHYSDDRGVSWTPSTLNNEAILRLAEDRKGNLFAGTVDGGLWESVDNGESWQQIWKTIRAVASVGIDPDGDILAGTDSGVYRLAVGDTTWRLISQPGIAIRSILATSTGVLLAGSEREGIWRSADGGETWLQVAEVLRDDGLWIWDLAELPSGKLAAATTGQGVWTSDDEGASWQPLPGTGDVVGADLTLSQNGELVAVGLLGQVFLLNRGSSHAVGIGPPFLSAQVRSVVVMDDGTVLIGTEALGVHVLEGFRIVASEPTRVIQSKGELSVYPNPALLSATLRLRIDRPSAIRWEILDLLGRTRQAGDTEATGGVWTTRLDLSALAAGFYWLRVRAAGLDLNRGVVVTR